MFLSQLEQFSILPLITILEYNFITFILTNKNSILEAFCPIFYKTLIYFRFFVVCYKNFFFVPFLLVFYTTFSLFFSVAHCENKGVTSGDYAWVGLYIVGMLYIWIADDSPDETEEEKEELRQLRPWRIAGWVIVMLGCIIRFFIVVAE